MGLQANTVAWFYRKIRKVIINNMDEIVHEKGQLEADESYFGGDRKGKRERGTSGEVPVFGILKREEKFTRKWYQTPSLKHYSLRLKTKILPDSIVYTDSYRRYDVLDIANFKHYRINHSKLFADRQNPSINGIENFWNQAKRHLRKFNGIPKHHFNFYLKECEWRFNMGAPKQLLQDLKNILKEFY